MLSHDHFCHSEKHLLSNRHLACSAAEWRDLSRQISRLRYTSLEMTTRR